jgi:hypothetical protein
MRVSRIIFASVAVLLQTLHCYGREVVASPPLPGISPDCSFRATYPKQYIVHATKAPPIIDGRLDDAAWKEVPFTEVMPMPLRDLPVAVQFVPPNLLVNQDMLRGYDSHVQVLFLPEHRLAGGLNHLLHPTFTKPK